MYDVPALTTLASGQIISRDVLTVRGKTLGGTPTLFVYWTGEDNIVVNLVPAGGVTPESRNAIGGGTLLEVPQIVDAIGVEARSITVDLNHILTFAGSPMDMVFGNNVRVAPLEIHRILFDSDTGNVVSSYILFSGRVDGISLDDSVPDSSGGLELAAMSDAIDMTKKNPAMESDEQQKRRSGDRFRRYGDTAIKVDRWWGMAGS